MSHLSFCVLGLRQGHQNNNFTLPWKGAGKLAGLPGARGGAKAVLLSVVRVGGMEEMGA